MALTYVCGDGRRFRSFVAAVAHANHVFDTTGCVISVVKISREG